LGNLTGSATRLESSLPPPTQACDPPSGIFSKAGKLAVLAQRSTGILVLVLTSGPLLRELSEDLVCSPTGTAEKKTDSIIVIKIESSLRSWAFRIFLKRFVLQSPLKPLSLLVPIISPHGYTKTGAALKLIPTSSCKSFRKSNLCALS
jgi:hypothetical protein